MRLFEEIRENVENGRKDRKRKKGAFRAFVSRAKNRLDVNQLTF